MTSRAQLPFEAYASDRVKSYLENIKSHWQKATDSILDVAKLCAKADAELTRHEKKDLLDELPFSPPTFSKLVKIGHDARLQPQRVQKLLPPNYSVIYEIAKLDDGAFKSAVNQKVINPSVTREKIQHWGMKRAGKDQQAKSRSAGQPDLPFYVAIHLPPKTATQKLKDIERWLGSLEKEAGAELIRPFDLPEYRKLAERSDREHARLLVRVSRRLRVLVKRRIAELKKRQDKWGFLKDETDLDVPDGEIGDRVKEVLAIIGIEDEFDALYKKAERETSSKRMEKLQKRLDAIPFAEANQQIAIVTAPQKRVPGLPRSKLLNFK